MAPSDDDEDMKRAIALSLQDEATTSRESRSVGQSFRDAIALDSETEDEDEPPEISKLAQEDAVGKDKNISHTRFHHDAGTSVGKNVESDPSVSTSSLSFLGIDRKKMEQERLARKRKVSTSPPPPRKAPRVSPSVPIESRTLFSQSATNTTSQVIVEPKHTSEGNSSVEIRFPRGTVKKTWAFGHSRTGDDIKLEEVLQKDDLNSAVLSSFQWDMGWLLANINTRSMAILPSYWGVARDLVLIARQTPRSRWSCKPKMRRPSSNTDARQPLCRTYASASRQWRDKSIACIPNSCYFPTLHIYALPCLQPTWFPTTGANQETWRIWCFSSISLDYLMAKVLHQRI